MKPLSATAGSRPVIHGSLGFDQLRDRLAAGLPEEFAALPAGLDLSIAEGAEDRTTDTVERVTGRTDGAPRRAGRCTSRSPNATLR
ncbi:hypothetical protein [Streptomyces sp. NPDC056987]|uniref:hypothetical protein n=1 Tax=Streptomyces sp. NPDC056987 TaxID=3345988 RepID=UPI003638A54E